MRCELCSFNNPRCTATAVIICDGKLLLVRRNKEPHKGRWDLPGGYVEKNEKPVTALHRELIEELGIRPSSTSVDVFPGEATWKKKRFAILSHVFLADIGKQKIKLNSENNRYKFVGFNEINPRLVAFDSNRAIVRFIKKQFGGFKMNEVKNLIEQLDPSADVNEQSLYRAILNGHVIAVHRQGKLVGMGWVFIRQTLLRKQGVVEDMIVDEKYRGDGIGRTILRKLIRLAKKEKVEMLELTTNKRRIAANRLYQSEGFLLHPTNHYLLKLS